jgi:hypothetical protein
LTHGASIEVSLRGRQTALFAPPNEAVEKLGFFYSLNVMFEPRVALNASAPNIC